MLGVVLWQGPKHDPERDDDDNLPSKRKPIWYKTMRSQFPGHVRLHPKHTIQRGSPIHGTSHTVEGLQFTLYP